MIRVVHAFKRYGSAESGVAALSDVSLEIPAGQFVAIMGPSGCGKSTLLHVLGGLDRLDQGEIHLDGQPIHQLDEAGLTQLRRDKIGIVFQFFNLLPTLTVEENVVLPGLLRGDSSRKLEERGRLLLAEVGLEHRRRHQLHQLSGGEMQRAALARALILEPTVILADEPTGNLDSEASARVVQLFSKLGREHKTTIVMVTHSREVAGCAERLVEMKDGRIVA